MKLVTPLSIGGGIVLPYTDELYAAHAKKDRYGESYNLSRIIGSEAQRRLVVPRKLYPIGPSTTDLRKEGLPWKFKSSWEPWHAEQTKCVDEISKRVIAEENFIFKAPTGWGKTPSALEVVARVGKVTLVIVIREDIRDQWVTHARNILGLDFGKGLGLIQGNTCVTENCGLVIGVLNSVAKEDRYPAYVMNQFGFVIWDEVHKVGSDFFSESALRVPAKRRLGISASERKDGRQQVITYHIGHVGVTATLMPMIPKVFAVKSPWQIPMVKVRDKETKEVMVVPLPHWHGKCAGVFKAMSRSEIRNKKLVGIIMSGYKKGRIVLIQAEHVNHLKILMGLVKAQGVPITAIGHYEQGLKEEQRALVKKKQLIFATYKMTAEATDIPQLDMLVMATPRADVEQIVGRVIRFMPGKKVPAIFDLIDHCSNVLLDYWGSRKKWYQSKGAEIEMC